MKGEAYRQARTLFTWFFNNFMCMVRYILGTATNSGRVYMSALFTMSDMHAGAT
jgi:hypothetical protein